MTRNRLNSRIVIAGGGIAGLSIAWALRRQEPSMNVAVLERSGRTGGNIRTEQEGGYVCEAGPDGFLDNAPATLALVRQLGLTSRLLPSSDKARRRYIFHNGTLSPVPMAPGAFLKTPLLSARGKLRLLAEPFARRGEDIDESIHDFASRRIGSEAAAVFVDSMVSGIFAGDAHALSLGAAFPRMRQLEEEHGGLLRAYFATRRRTKAEFGAPAGRLTSFAAGMSTLTDELTRALGGAVHTATPVLAVQRRQRPIASAHVCDPPEYDVTTSAGIIAADVVVLSGPAPDAGAILHDLDPVLASVVEGIVGAPLTVVCLGYDAARVAAQSSVDGFGFLVPRHERVRILGALWESSIYAGRAPQGKVLMRVMVGGATDPAGAALSDSELLQVVRADLARTMNLSAPPEFVRIVRHARGIPQYVKGHLARMHQIDSLLQAHRGLYLAGNSYRGVSINSCIAEADRIAEAILRYVDSASERRVNALASVR